MTLALDQSPPAGSLVARPFLKWAGGKTQLLADLLPRRPASFGAYFEPFVGSGALFFALRSRGLLREVHLSDTNPRLIDTYRAVRDDVEGVIEALAAYRNDRDQYYRVRSQRHDDLRPAGRAARIIYLNKTCYNGLFRENSRGEFNVPFGRYANPRICDAENLRAVSDALQGADLACHDFEAACARVRPGDFVYFDPPYHPVSATSSFTAYHQGGFGEAEQRRLADLFAELASRGACVMLSNSDTPLVRELYAAFPIERVEATRAINSVGTKRGKVGEAIVRSYSRH